MLIHIWEEDINFPSCSPNFCKINVGAAPTSANEVSGLRSNLFYEYATPSPSLLLVLGERFTKNDARNGFLLVAKENVVAPNYPRILLYPRNVYYISTIFANRISISTRPRQSEISYGIFSSGRYSSLCFDRVETVRDNISARH